jgi:predicted NAD/FAD-dependent oxidoreductase
MTTPTPPTAVDVLIIGAGMAGLTAAAALRQSPVRTLILDKGRGVGGRIASRRIGGATFDHGAQFITTHTARFAEAVEQWTRAGVTEEWCRGFTGDSDGHPRWLARPAMTAIPKHLAEGLPIQLQCQITALRNTGEAWQAETAAGEIFTAPAVILTAPVPQSLALLDAGAAEIPPALRIQLQAITYERCLAVMTVLDGPSRIPAPGGVPQPHPDIAWLADNQLKGISAEPAVTLHATHAFSMAHWERDRDETARTLLAAAAPWLGAPVQSFQVHGWRYSRPIEMIPSPVLTVTDFPLLLLAGDAFGGPRVEGAALSGWAAAEALLVARPATRPAIIANRSRFG